MIEAKIEDLIGKIIKSIDSRQDSIIFNTEGGDCYSMFHYQDCCESVYVEEIIGDLDDLIGVPILKAEERTNVDKEPVSVNAESFTWTFYELATIKGYVTIRWYGESNGYYSESVSFELVD